MNKTVLICGDRYWKDIETIEEFIKSLHPDTRIISGGARGADTIAECLRKKYDLDGQVYDAKWNRYGNAAGPIRNQKMIDESPDLVVAFHNNISKSKGTIDTLRKARKRGIPYQVRKSDGSVEYEPRV